MTNPTIEVLVDLDDDIRTTRALREHFEGGGARVLAIPPFALDSTQLVWTILRALGKHTSTVARLNDVGWPEATTWLHAHGIHTLVVLCAQHLQRESNDELRRNARAAGVSLILVYGQTAGEAANTSLHELLNRPVAPPTTPPNSDPWPCVPESHPLRFRFDCEQQLDLADFVVVEELLQDVHNSLFNYLIATRTPDQIDAAVAVLMYGEDPSQRHIRRCGVALALIGSGVATPAQPETPIATRVSAEGVDTALQHARPTVAAFVLVQALTGLDHRLLTLISGDQLKGRRILGVPIPARAAAIQHALADNASLCAPHDIIYSSAAPRPDCPGSKSPVPEIVKVLERLLFTRNQREPANELQPRTRTELDKLVALGVIDLDDGVYRISRLGAYSSFLSNANRPSVFKQDAY
jgi:hypothetical protein